MLDRLLPDFGGVDGHFQVLLDERLTDIGIKSIRAQTILRLFFDNFIFVGSFRIDDAINHIGYCIRPGQMRRRATA